MSLTPAFEIGFWNAWILTIFLALHPFLVRIIAGKGFLARFDWLAGMTVSKRDITIGYLATSLFYLLVIYSIFLPLKLGTVWLYIGLPLALVGLILFTLTHFGAAQAPASEPFTQGMYRFSRHPMYVTWSITLIGIGIASASWLFLLVAAVATAPSVYHALLEERACLKQYGDAYREYMERTPRWLGIPKAGESN